MKKPKRHFTDSSLAAAALGATPQMLNKDLNTFGYLVEALCVYNLKVYSDYYDGKVYYYRDKRDNEANAIVELPDGRWGMFEIKGGFNQVEKAAAELVSLKQNLRPNPVPLRFLCVICGMANMAYQRPDGVYVVHITALGI